MTHWPLPPSGIMGSNFWVPTRGDNKDTPPSKSRQCSISMQGAADTPGRGHLFRPPAPVGKRATLPLSSQGDFGGTESCLIFITCSTEGVALSPLFRSSAVTDSRIHQNGLHLGMLIIILKLPYIKKIWNHTECILWPHSNWKPTPEI